MGKRGKRKRAALKREAAANGAKRPVLSQYGKADDNESRVPQLCAVLSCLSVRMDLFHTMPRFRSLRVALRRPVEELAKSFGAKPSKKQRKQQRQLQQQRQQRHATGCYSELLTAGAAEAAGLIWQLVGGTDGVEHATVTASSLLLTSGHSKAHKDLRRVLSPFVLARIEEDASTSSQRVSIAFRDGRQEDMLVLLRQMKSFPKLGCVQRWVRDLLNQEGAHLGEAKVVRTLDAIMRLMPVTWRWQSTGAPTPAACAVVDPPLVGSCGTPQQQPLIKWFPLFEVSARAAPVPSDPKEISCGVPPMREEGHYSGDCGTRGRELICRKDAPAWRQRCNFKLAHHEKGRLRQPTNKYDLNIYTITPGSAFISIARTSSNDTSGAPAMDSPTQRRVDVPDVPGAFVITGVLSRDECEQMIAIAEASPTGYVLDEPVTAASTGNVAGRATQFQLLSRDITERIFARCRPHLPQKLGPHGDHVLPLQDGLNARMRFYRYNVGAVYRPHVDGSWPGGGLTSEDEGEDAYVHDAFGDRWSRLTVVLYLNEDMEGGHTNFYSPAPLQGHIEARGVSPRLGAALVFPHGGSAGSLVHEGSAVTRGAKYIIRTEVLYTIPGHTAAPAASASLASQ